LVTAAPAQAADQRYPNQRASHDPRLNAMVVAADIYWTRRGFEPVDGCAQPGLDVADDLRGSDGQQLPAHEIVGRALIDQCRIVLDARLVGGRLVTVNHRWTGLRIGLRLRIRRYALQEICSWIVHETGHLRGRPHTRRGIMAESADELPVPFECMVLSHRVVRRRSERDPHPLAA
jgi:hypothetical protein